MRKKDDGKQKSIKEAVVKLTLEEGFHGTSMSKIAKKAGVSPATVYIYYESKESMLHEIYEEYSEEIYNHLLSKVRKDVEGREFIEILIRSYYNYIQDHEEVFRFVDQFSSCPALSNHCQKKKGSELLNRLLKDMKEKNIIKDFYTYSLVAMLFSPVKSIAVNHFVEETEKLAILEEVITIIQDALIA